MSDCIFCKIAAGEIPASVLYEDEDVFVFRDISPQTPIHLLVIPKVHLGSIADITPENSHLVARCYEVIAMLAKIEGLEKGYRVIANCGEDAGQTVFHLHFHVLAGRTLGEKLI